MSRYIDADALREKWLCLQGHDFSPSSFVYSIDNMPTVDAVPVVRCRECKHHEVFKNGVNGWCNGHERPTDVTYFCADGERKDNETELKGEKNMKKNCIDCSKANVIEDGVIECKSENYDIHTKTCFVPKICKVEKNQRLVEHIMEFDSQGKEYDWYEQHIALIDGEQKDGEQ